MNEVERRPKVQIETWGCKVNTYDSGLLESRFMKSGFQVLDSSQRKKQVLDQPVIHVLNSCAVTLEATREVLKRAARIKNQNPSAKVILTGCAAQVDGTLVDQSNAVDLVIANSHKDSLEYAIAKLSVGGSHEKVLRSNIFLKQDLEEGGGIESAHTRAFLKIQDGCNSFCTYCVIPFARGRSRSVPIDRLLERANELYAEGARELVITGVHIADYDDESASGGGGRLVDVVGALCEKTDFSRIRLSSLEPGELSDELLGLFEQSIHHHSRPQLCPSFHLSIQSLNAKVLKLMKRQYSPEKALWALNRVRQLFPESYVAMDLIVGFPGETEVEFLDTVRKLEHSPWTKVHVFPYSERPMTKAIGLSESVPLQERKRRAKLIREISFRRMREEAQKQIGKKVEGLKIQSQTESQLDFVARNMWKVVCTQPSKHFGTLSNGELKTLEIVGVEINSSHDVVLRGELLN